MFFFADFLLIANNDFDDGNFKLTFHLKTNKSTHSLSLCSVKFRLWKWGLSLCILLFGDSKYSFLDKRVKQIKREIYVQIA